MSSPFSKSMSTVYTRLTSQLGASEVPHLPKIESAPSIMEPEIVPTQPSKPVFAFLTPYKVYLRQPLIIFVTCFLIIFSALFITRKWIWKNKESRPSATKLLLYVLIAFIPFFFWFFIRK